MQFGEELKKIHKKREEIKKLHDRMQELKDLSDSRKQEFLKELEKDEKLNSYSKEYNEVFQKHSDLVGEFSVDMDSLIDMVGSQE